MSKGTKIIEFFGMPSCGKTTLCNTLQNKNEQQGKMVAITENLANEYANSSLWKKTRSIPVYILFSLLRLFAAVPFTGFSYLRRYKVLLRKEILYNFAKRYSKYDYVYIDHGLAQGLIQLVYEYPDSLNEKTLLLAKKVFQKSKADSIVYCKVSPETTLKRIRKRNSPRKSRLDCINDDNVLIQKLSLQELLFDKLAKMLNGFNKERFYIINNE